MTLSSIGEFGLIQRLQKILGPPAIQGSIVGIGDDTSVFHLKKNSYLLLTQDLLLEGIHFDPGRFANRPYSDFADLGYKALAVNLSDIAAMGGYPLQATVGLGLPESARTMEVEALYRGFKEGVKKFRCPILGGDTNRSKGGWMIAVSVLGISQKFPILRSGARVGDSLWVTGTLGSAALGWESIKRRNRSPLFSSFRRSHARPEPRLDWGQKLLSCGMVTAMLDVSDGLAGDLRQLSVSSRVGFQVDLENVPLEDKFLERCRDLKLKPERIFLEGGEDYELMFTVQAGEAMDFLKWIKKKKIPATLIGRTVRGKSVKFFQQGKKMRGTFRGFTHF